MMEWNRNLGRGVLVGLPVLTCMLLLVAGCPQPTPTPECTTDADCTGDMVCNDAGECVAPTITPADTFPTSLHATREGKAYFYSADQGGIELLTGIPMSDLECQACHAATYADGTDVDAETYEPGCADCHADPDNPSGDIPDSVCLPCHGRQSAEINVHGFTDVHRDAGFTCVRCHGDTDVHGDGTAYNSLLDEGAIGAACENCHVEAGEAGAPPENTAHSLHGETVDCSACHVQSVITCYNCHLDSDIAGAKRGFKQFSGFKFLVQRNGKVHPASFQSITYQGDDEEVETFYVIAPFYSHSITATPQCSDCHDNAAVAEYRETGNMTIGTWDADASTIVGPTGTIPIPPDWQTSLLFDFINYTGDPATPVADTDPTLWEFVKTGADLTQMLFAEPLTADQIDALE